MPNTPCPPNSNLQFRPHFVTLRESSRLINWSLDEEYLRQLREAELPSPREIFYMPSHSSENEPHPNFGPGDIVQRIGNYGDLIHDGKYSVDRVVRHEGYSGRVYFSVHLWGYTGTFSPKNFIKVSGKDRRKSGFGKFVKDNKL